jgi:hypothetical protein
MGGVPTGVQSKRLDPIVLNFYKRGYAKLPQNFLFPVETEKDPTSAELELGIKYDALNPIQENKRCHAREIPTVQPCPPRNATLCQQCAQLHSC